MSRGQVVQADQLDQVLSVLASLPEPAPSGRRVQLWSHPLVAGFLIVLMTAFWIGRKMIGLV